MIEIIDISKIYQMGGGKVRALDHVSLRIEEGEFTAIIGPSGSGKSTLMNMIGCLDTPSSGQYLLDGEDVSHLNDDQQALIRNKKLGFIFQNYNLLAKLSVLENVELPMIYRKTPKAERRRLSLEALDRVGLSDRIHHRPSELSGGQQQRVSIARAIAGKPSILLADEPTGALDQASGREILGILRELNREGRTVVIITHDTGIAEQTDRIIRIVDGRIDSDTGVGRLSAIQNQGVR